MTIYLLQQCSYLAPPHTDTGAAGSLPLLLTWVVLFLYWTGVGYLKRHQKSWMLHRSLFFTAGSLILATAFTPQAMDYAHHSFQGHMVQHLLIGMAAPIGLTLGAPVTLALKVLPRSTGRRMAMVLRSSFFHGLCHPVTALLLNTGGLFVLYLTPLFARTLTTPYLHPLVLLHFLLAGYLFTWSMIGPDPAPRKPKYALRLAVLFISMAAHAYLSKMMYAYTLPRNTLFTEEEIRAGAQLMYYGGDLTELLVLLALLTLWYRKRGRPHYAFSPWLD